MRTGESRNGARAARGGTSANRLALLASLAALTGVLPGFGPIGPPVAGAAVIRVPEDATSLRAGLALATDGDTVRVAAGTWSSDDDRDLTFDGKGLVLEGESGAAATILDCGGQGRAFHFRHDEDSTTVVRGFTVTGGSAEWGGAVHCANASPVIRECRFVLNAATAGGAIFYGGHSEPALFDSVFLENSASADGGAIYGAEWGGTIEGCTFEDNRAQDGGAIHSGPWSEITLRDCTFRRNEAMSGGAHTGFYFDGRMESCTFAFNRADVGGALDLYEAGGTVAACTFSMNEGGQVRCFGGDPRIVTSIFHCPAGEPAVLAHLYATPAVDSCCAWGPDGGGEVQGEVGEVLVADPLLCAPWGGNFGLCAGSPCLPGGNVWGVRLGARDQACGACASALRPQTWGRVKARYRQL